MNKFRALILAPLTAIGVLGSAYVWAQQGNAALPEPEVSMEVRDGFRTITSNGIPDHSTGQFPHRGNPGRISAQRHYFRMPMNPQVADKITPQRQGRIGVAINGIPFDPGTAEAWNNDPRSGWNQVAHAGTNDLGLDSSNAHVQPNGSYHYHGLPYGWLDKLPDADKPQIVLTGYAADGFPIYSLFGTTDANNPKSALKELRSSYRLKEGTRPNGPGGRYDGTYDQDFEYVAGLGDLDECNGRSGVTPEYPGGTYYYVLTKEYPYVPRAFRGTPDETFLRRGPGGNRPGEDRPPGREMGPPPGEG